MSQSVRRQRKQGDVQEELSRIVVQTKTRQTKAAPKRSLSNVEEEEEDDGIESLHLKEPPRDAKKAKSKAAKETRFEATVQKDREELCEHLKDLAKKSEDADSRYRRQMKAFLESLGIPSSKTKEPRHQNEFNAMLATATRLVQTSQRLDRDFSAMVAAAENVRKGLGKEHALTTLQDDKKAAVQLLEKGMRLSMKRVDQLVPEGAKAGKRARSIDISSDLSYNEVSAYFQNTHPEESRLRDTLVQAAKGVKRFVRFLPEEEI